MAKKNNKVDKRVYLIFKVLFISFFAAIKFLDSILVHVKNIRGSAAKIYFSDVQVKNVFVFISCWILMYIIVIIIEKITNKISMYDKKRKGNKKYFFTILIIMLVAWLPYILTYFPGGIFSDTQDSLKQCLGLKDYNNSNPILYTLLLKVFLKIGNILGSHQIGISLFSIFQIIIMASILSYFIYWLYKKGISMWVLNIILIFFCFFKLIPLYAMSIWKDTIFSIILYLFIIFIADIALNKGKKLQDKKTIIIYCVALLIISFLRTNAFYVLFMFTLVMIVVYHKNGIRVFEIASITALILVYIIKGPVFSQVGLTTGRGSFNAVEINQILYVKVKDGNITSKQNRIISKIFLDEKELKKVYSPTLVDSIVISPKFDRMYVVHHKKKIHKLWGELLNQNPDLYTEAYLLNTLGFWDTDKQLSDAYISTKMWPGTKKMFGIQRVNVIKEATGVSIHKLTRPWILISSAIFLLIMLLSALITIYKRKYHNLIIYLPALFVWGTIMLATPIAFSLRYVYILVLMVPFDLVIPFLKTEK